MSYRINEGKLNVQVLHDRTANVLMLEAWGHGEPVNLTISRGMKSPQETLQDCVARQVKDMSAQLEAFKWTNTGQRKTATLVYETGRSSYKLGPTQIDQLVATAQLTEEHLLFLFLSSDKPLEEPVLAQWAHILDSFEPDHGELPNTTSSDTDDEEEDEEGSDE